LTASKVFLFSVVLSVPPQITACLATSVFAAGSNGNLLKVHGWSAFLAIWADLPALEIADSSHGQPAAYSPAYEAQMKEKIRPGFTKWRT
jgi:hypothetical protein